MTHYFQMFILVGLLQLLYLSKISLLQPRHGSDLLADPAALHSQLPLPVCQQLPQVRTGGGHYHLVLIMYRQSINRLSVGPRLSRSTTMDKTDIEKVKKMKLPSRKVNQAPPPLVRSNTVLGGSNKVNKTLHYLCR